MDLSKKTIITFEGQIGYSFKNKDLLIESLTHPSFSPEKQNNQRLEFLGDAVIQLILTRKFFVEYPTEREGILRRYRTTLAQGSFLTHLALKLGIDKVLQVSPAERSVQGHLRSAALEDAFEALVGAIFTDTESDLTKTTDIILSWYGDISAHLQNQEETLNPKGRLQELIQPKHGNDALSYVVVRMEGQPHEREFEVEVFLFDQSLGFGLGKSKKEAEEEAARQALIKIAP